MADVYAGMMAGAYPLATVILLITASLISILYMVAHIINNRKIESWVKNEIFQCFATVVLLFLAVGLLSLASELAGTFLTEVANANGLQDVVALVTSNQQLGNAPEPHIMFARVYLLSRLDVLSEMYNSLFYMYALTSTAGMSGAWFPEQGLIKVGLGSLAAIGNFIQPILEYIYYGFLFVYFQLGLLEIIDSYFFYAFPAGLVLRSFPFTRSLGSFLIATAIGLYFVYPFFLSLLLLTNYETTLDINEDAIMGLIKNEYPSQYLVYYVQQRLLHEDVAGATSTSASSLSMWGKISSAVQFLLLTMILYPLIAIIAAYTFIHQFAALMQANVADLGRGLVKLI